MECLARGLLNMLKDPYLTVQSTKVNTNDGHGVLLLECGERVERERERKSGWKENKERVQESKGSSR